MDELIDGTLGFFFPVSGSIPDIETEEPERGYARIEGNELRVTTLVEDIDAAHRDTGPRRPPRALLALTPAGTSLMLRVAGPGHGFGFGARASTASYSVATVVGAIDVTRLTSTKLTGVTARFDGVGAWAGVTSSSESSTRDDDGRVEALTISLQSPPPEVTRLGNDRSLMIAGYWRLNGPPHRRQIQTPVAISCTSTQAVDAVDLLRPVWHVQTLMSLSFEGVVLASSGSADGCLRADPSARYQDATWLWDHDLMTSPEGAPAPTTMSLGYFTLADLGGITSVSRWIELCDRHPRGIDALVRAVRLPSTAPPVALMDVASSIEYWVKAHPLSLQANPRHYASTLALQGGERFGEWVGDPERWSALFWSTYNEVKHDLDARMEPRLLDVLASSARLLLTAAVLDHVAGTHAPSDSIFGCARATFLGQALRDRLVDPPRRA